MDPEFILLGISSPTIPNQPPPSSGAENCIVVHPKANTDVMVDIPRSDTIDPSSSHQIRFTPSFSSKFFCLTSQIVTLLFSVLKQQ